MTPMESIKGRCREHRSTLGGCSCLIFVISVILFSCSFTVIRVHEIALLYNTHTRSVDPDIILEQGRHFVGVNKHAIVFPRLVQQVAFIDATSSDYCHSCVARAKKEEQPLLIYPSVKVWTGDGQETTLDISVAYRLVHEEVHKLYEKYLHGYNQVVVDVILATIRNTCPLWETEEFFSNRASLGDAITAALSTALLHMHVELYSFQLRAIRVSAVWEEEIEHKINLKQQAKLALFAQSKTLIEASTKRIEAEVSRNISIFTAASRSYSEQVQGEAMQTVQEMMGVTMAAEYGNFQKTFNMTGAELLDFQWVSQLGLHTHPDTSLHSDLRPLMIELGSSVVVNTLHNNSLQPPRVPPPISSAHSADSNRAPYALPSRPLATEPAPVQGVSPAAHLPAPLLAISTMWAVSSALLVACWAF